MQPTGYQLDNGFPVQSNCTGKQSKGYVSGASIQRTCGLVAGPRRECGRFLIGV